MCTNNNSHKSITGVIIWQVFRMQKFESTLVLPFAIVLSSRNLGQMT